MLTPGCHLCAQIAALQEQKEELEDELESARAQLKRKDQEIGQLRAQNDQLRAQFDGEVRPPTPCATLLTPTLFCCCDITANVTAHPTRSADEGVHSVGVQCTILSRLPDLVHDLGVQTTSHEVGAEPIKAIAHRRQRPGRGPRCTPPPARAGMRASRRCRPASSRASSAKLQTRTAMPDR